MICSEVALGDVHCFLEVRRYDVVPAWGRLEMLGFERAARGVFQPGETGAVEGEVLHPVSGIVNDDISHNVENAVRLELGCGLGESIELVWLFATVDWKVG